MSAPFAYVGLRAFARRYKDAIGNFVVFANRGGAGAASLVRTRALIPWFWRMS
jgi:hypothetical protein